MANFIHNIKEEIRDRLKLIGIMQKMPYLSVNHVHDLFGYNEEDSVELIKLFLDNCTVFDGTIDLTDRKEFKTLGILERVEGALYLGDSSIVTLGKLKHVGSTLGVYDTPLCSTGDLAFIGGNFNAGRTLIKSLDNIMFIEGNANLYDSMLEDLGSLTSVEGNLNIKKTPLSKTATRESIRKQCHVANFIYIKSK